MPAHHLPLEADLEAATRPAPSLC
eukprot:COSAG01_NODE_1166_length_11442_cov_6.607511_13_plen_23_part_01